MPGRLVRLGRDRRLLLVARLGSRLQSHELIDRGAALTYYGLLSIVPGLLVMFSVIGLIGTDQTVNEVIDIVDDVGPSNSEAPTRAQLRDLVSSDVKSGTLLGVGLIAVLWTASAYVGSFFRASATIWGVEHRPVWRAWPARMGLTTVILLLLALALLTIVVTGQLAKAIGDAVGLGDATVTLYEIVKWPALLVVVVLLVSVLYRASPSRSRAAVGWRLLTPGGTVAVGAWLLVSGAFTVYARYFASYDTAYGALGTTIATMVWLWLTNLVLLLGVETDAEIERRADAARLAEATPSGPAGAAPTPHVRTD